MISIELIYSKARFLSYALPIPQSPTDQAIFFISCLNLVYSPHHFLSLVIRSVLAFCTSAGTSTEAKLFSQEPLIFFHALSCVYLLCQAAICLLALSVSVTTPSNGGQECKTEKTRRKYPHNIWNYNKIIFKFYLNFVSL